MVSAWQNAQNVSWQKEHQTSALTVYTTQLLIEKYGKQEGKFYPIQELHQHVEEHKKGQEITIIDLGQDSRANGSTDQYLAQVTIANQKCVGAGETRKEAKQNAAHAMLISLRNGGKGAQMLKYKETEAGAKSGWPVPGQAKRVPDAVKSTENFNENLKKKTILSHF